MNRPLVDKLARALLYEGYVLYPYRPSVKNSQRWTFGGIYPRTWSQEQSGADACSMQTECLISGTNQARVHIIVRFLHLIDRKVGELTTPMNALPTDRDPEYRPVPSLQIGDDVYQSWQEAEEREIDLGEIPLAELIRQPHRTRFNYPKRHAIEPLRDPSQIAAILIRDQQPLESAIEISASNIAENLFKLTVRIVNETNLPVSGTRDQALMQSLISTHTILGAGNGQFVSLTDPPEIWKHEAAECRNIGAWPVLVGEAPEADTILSSPIILYDYPQLAPESPGDLFDSTEIDEILTLRILTLTDEEKRAASGVDNRVRDLLSRTESLARDQLMNLHGTMRGLRPVPQEQSHD